MHISAFTAVVKPGFCVLSGHESIGTCARATPKVGALINTHVGVTNQSNTANITVKKEQI